MKHHQAISFDHLTTLGSQNSKETNGFSWLLTSLLELAPKGECFANNKSDRGSQSFHPPIVLISEWIVFSPHPLRFFHLRGQDTRGLPFTVDHSKRLSKTRVFTCFHHFLPISTSPKNVLYISPFFIGHVHKKCINVTPNLWRFFGTQPFSMNQTSAIFLPPPPWRLASWPGGSPQASPPELHPCPYSPASRRCSSGAVVFLVGFWLLGLFLRFLVQNCLFHDFGDHVLFWVYDSVSQRWNSISQYVKDVLCTVFDILLFYS